MLIINICRYKIVVLFSSHKHFQPSYFLLTTFQFILDCKWKIYRTRWLLYNELELCTSGEHEQCTSGKGFIERFAFAFLWKVLLVFSGGRYWTKYEGIMIIGMWKLVIVMYFLFAINFTLLSVIIKLHHILKSNT